MKLRSTVVALLIAVAIAVPTAAARPGGSNLEPRVAALEAQVADLTSRVTELEASPGPTPSPTPTPGPSASPAPTPTPAPDGMPTTDLPGWRLIFNDAFDQAIAEGQFPAAVSTRWYAYPNGWDDTSNNGHYDPSIVSWHDGLLDAQIRTTAGVHRVAAFGPKLPGGATSQLYGRYAIRFRADSMRGYKGAWLLWPASETWPRDGEIDFPEGDFDSTISAFMHRQGATTGSDQDAFPTPARWTDWHTAVTEWSPGLVVFRLDGQEIGRSTTRIPNTPMRWVIQNETTLAGFEPADSVQGHVLIDWLAVWAYAP